MYRHFNGKVNHTLYVLTKNSTAIIKMNIQKIYSALNVLKKAVQWSKMVKHITAFSVHIRITCSKNLAKEMIKHTQPFKPPIYLYLNFEIPSLKNRVWQT